MYMYIYIYIYDIYDDIYDIYARYNADVILDTKTNLPFKFPVIFYSLILTLTKLVIKFFYSIYIL